MNFKYLATDRSSLKKFIKGLPECKKGIGFIPIKYHKANKLDKKTYGDSAQIVYDKIELLEYSAVEEEDKE